MAVAQLYAAHLVMSQCLDDIKAQNVGVKRLIKHFDKPGQLRGPLTIGDIPAIEVMVGGANTAWKNNQSQEITYTFRLSITVPEHSQTKAEELWQWTHAKIWQRFDVSLAQGNAHRLLPATPATVLEGELDGQTVTVWTWEQPVIVGVWNPRTYS